MKRLQIRNVPDDLHTALKSRAIAEGVTMSELIRRELHRIAHKPSMKQILARIDSDESVLGPESSAGIIRRHRDAG